MAEATIRKLADARLVVTERDASSGRDTVELTHEALIRGWQRLRGWVDQDREFLRARERIAAQAKLWVNEGRPRDRVLPAGRPLAEGEDLLAKRRNDLEPLLLDYVEAPAAVARVDEKRRRRRTRALMAIITLLAVGGGAIAWWQRGEANRNAAVAQLNQSRALAALANTEAAVGSPATAIRLALATVPESIAKPTHLYAREAEGAALHAVQQAGIA